MEVGRPNFRVQVGGTWSHQCIGLPAILRSLDSDRAGPAGVLAGRAKGPGAKAPPRKRVAFRPPSELGV